MIGAPAESSDLAPGILPIMDYRFDDALRRRVESNLAAFSPRTIEDPDLRQAAVAIVVVPEPGSDLPCVLLTRRPSGLRRHGGQFALPGGRLDAGETPAAAALRELEEELGLRLDPARIMGRLDDYPTRSGFRITPFVLWCTGAAALDPDPEEVEAVFHIPLAELDSPEIPHLEVMTQGAQPVLSAPLPTTGGQVYAPTAAMLYQFREVALRGEPTPVSHYEQPAFAWK